MARSASRCKKCRQLGYSVCGSERCALERKPDPPGMHPHIRRRMSNYRRQLIEKQRLRFTYWISEEQLRGYVKRAFAKHGASGENLLRLLEARLDNVVYRLGFAPTVRAARQMVVHGHVRVNGRRLDKPSYATRPGDVVSIEERSRGILPVKEGMVRSQARPELTYLSVDKEHFKGTITHIPKRPQIPLPIDEKMIVEYYSKFI